MTFPRVAVAMSGGVDSSVAAMLLKQAGYDVIGVTMRLKDSEHDNAFADTAAAVANKLGIKHHVIDLSKQFQNDVIDYFCETYRHGQTPNPCIVCNRLIKFGSLLEFADSLRAWHLATGHYARIRCTTSDYHLYKAIDTKKDQSYFLYRLDQIQLSRIILPLGEMTKNQVRQLADENSLPVNTAESQDICFLQGEDYHSFLESHFEFSPGNIVNEQNEVVGRHRGIGRYTIGQRHGLNVASNTPLYVLSIDPADNRVVVGNESSLLKPSVKIKDVHWISGSWPDVTQSLSARIRYRMADSDISILEQNGQTSATITFERPVRAVTPGQSAVIYRCDEVLGGGIITA